MKFQKHVKIEIRELLTQQLKEYEKNTKMSKHERRLLYEWVSSGRSPYDNELNISSGGYTLDFIGSLHVMQELEDGTGKVVNYQYDTLNDEIYIDVSFEAEQDMELPF